MSNRRSSTNCWETRGRGGTGVVLALSLLAAGACNAVKEPDEGSGAVARQSALSAKTSIPKDNDVSAIRYVIQRVDCATVAPTGSPIVEDRPLEDQVIPGNSENLQDNPLAKDSAHAFADLFIVVDPGCYDVTTTPVRGDGNPSKVCATAIKKSVPVADGKTTEIFLINQCKGKDPGALDIISAINHEPVIDDVRFTDSKFVCGSPAEICVRAHDIDGDPLELTLTAAGKSACEVVPLGPGEGMPMRGVKRCWEVTCHDFGKADVTAKVYDQLVSGGSSQRIEDWLTAQGYPGESHAEIALHAYFDGKKFYPDADGDGHGDAGAPAKLVCADDDDPDGHVPSNDDCNDHEAASHPGAPEKCGDDIDNDCDGEVDEGCPKTQCQDTWRCGQPAVTCACGAAGLCAETAEGDPQCVDGTTSCGGLPGCNTSADCPSGGRCFVSSCCGRKVCVAAPQMCVHPAASAKNGMSTEGPTFSGSK